MTAFLTFQLYGPMASWGEIAVGEERDSAMIPTRSAVLGLCAAATGITRDRADEVAAFHRAFGYGVWVLRGGAMLRDYHSVQTPEGKRGRDLPSRRKELEYTKVGTTLTKRQYRTDAYYVIGLWQRDGGHDRLEALQEALRHPAFPLYLGRKSCPVALPLNPIVETWGSLSEALRQYPRDQRMPRALGRGLVTTTLAWEPDPAIDAGADVLQTHQRWDRVTSRERWQFERREERLAVIEMNLEESS